MDEKTMQIVTAGSRAELAIQYVGDKLKKMQENRTLIMIQDFRSGKPPNDIYLHVAKLEAIDEIQMSLNTDVRKLRKHESSTTGTNK